MREINLPRPGMILLGITGGVGMGKSTGGKLLAAFGLPIIDTDLLARDLVEPGQPALAQIVAAFGPQILGPDRRLRRDSLARHVFSDPAARRQLETILHPRIRERWLAQASQWRAEGQRAACVVIPLLFETAAQSEFDATLCIACSSPTQRTRLNERGWAEKEIDSRIQAQWPVERKMLFARFVIWTEGSMAVHEAQLKRVLEHLSIL